MLIPLSVAAAVTAAALGYVYLRRLLLAVIGASGNVAALMSSEWSELAAIGAEKLADAGYANTGVTALAEHGGFVWLALIVAALFVAIAAISAVCLRAYRRRVETECASLTDYAISGAEPGVLQLDDTERLRRAMAVRFDENAKAAASMTKEQERYVRFLHDICHQIKTPLTTISVELELIKREGGEAHISRCEQQLERASELVSTLLRGGQFESGAVKLNWSKASLYLLFDDAAAELAPLARDKGVRISVTGDESALSPFDERWMREAVENILKNCIEHSESGSVINCSVIADSVRYGFAIESRGEHLPEGRDVFELYESGGTGTGIGLNLARHIISAHFGRLTAENTPEGCRFTAELPRIVRAEPKR